LEGFVFVSGMNALNVKLVKAHWHEHADLFQSQRICPEHCFASRPVGEASVLTHFLRRTKWASDWHEESDDCLNTFS